MPTVRFGRPSALSDSNVLVANSKGQILGAALSGLRSREKRHPRSLGDEDAEDLLRELVLDYQALTPQRPEVQERVPHAEVQQLPPVDFETFMYS